ncbi:aspergillopepsin-2 [Aspergillus udagawae]|uniref:Aspergillopepsin-2 n=1 Tax=Aspergillus udagawae TaxID=91492 RepID=A0ABQ1BA87_9EURO|nr:aspergillopepsin-2 [Aspergillus udagawae]GFF97237.1 aspergillopepsin-2 [Aspergillus udagawae]
MRLLSICLLIFTLSSSTLAVLLRRVRGPDSFRPGRISSPLQKSYPGSISGQKQSDDALRKVTQGSYSTNWAGAVISNSTPSATFSYVSATITIPTATATGDMSYQAASAWVGIDGATYTTAILQTGVDFYILNGKAYADPWYEWYPNFAMYYDELLVNPGDVIVAAVNVTASNRGVCVIENLTTGESATKSVSAPKSTATIKGLNAEWIVEDFQSNGAAVPFVGFDAVEFTGCVAEAAGVEFGVVNATVYDLVQDDTLLATARVMGDEEIVVTHI